MPESATDEMTRKDLSPGCHMDQQETRGLNSADTSGGFQYLLEQ